MSKNASRHQSKYWCFTVNNYGTDDVLRIRRLGRLPQVSFLIFGREGRGTDSTPHLQGYVAYTKRRRRSRVSRDLNGRAHIEARKGTAEEASEYCRKEKDFEEFGTNENTTQGQRSDLEQIRKRIKAGATELEIADSSFSLWVQYRKGFSAYRDLANSTNEHRISLRVVVLTGLTGTGKSRLAYKAYPDLWSAPDPSLTWFDGYRGANVVLFDDFRGAGVVPHFLLKVLDIYPLQVPVKGGFVPWLPNVVIITSNEPPPFGLERVADALRRRICTIITMNEILDFEDEPKVAEYVNKIRN